MSGYTATTETPFLKSLFANLKILKQDYCVLRNYSFLPYDLKGSDLDILTYKKTLNLATELILNSVKTHNGFAVWREWNDCLRIVLCFGTDSNGIRWGVPIHLFTSIRWKGLNYYPSGETLKDSILHNGIRGANSFDANLISVLNKLLYLGTVPSQYSISAIATQPEYISKLKRRLTSYFGSKVDSFLSIFTPGKSVIVENLARQLRNALIFRSIIKSPLSSVRNKVDRLFVHCHRLRHRSGLLVSVFGTDGSGKTALIESVRPKMDRFLHSQTSVFHWRPSLFPALATLTGKDVEEPGLINKPHTKVASGFFGSLFRLAYYSLDHTLGFWFVVCPKLVRLPTVVFFDRYFHDNFLDSARFRICLPYWVVSLFAKIIPQPDLGIFLKVSPEVAFSRKPELSIAEHLRQQERMLNLATKFKHFQFVSTDGPIGKSQNKFLDAIIDQFKVHKGWN